MHDRGGLEPPSLLVLRSVLPPELSGRNGSRRTGSRERSAGLRSGEQFESVARVELRLRLGTDALEHLRRRNRSEPVDRGERVLLLASEDPDAVHLDEHAAERVVRTDDLIAIVV